jgi:stress-induced-phosphoprotein 1
MGIMQDPIMQSILQQAQADPAALQEHMKNPGINNKIQRLVAGKQLPPFPIFTYKY